MWAGPRDYPDRNASGGGRWASEDRHPCPTNVRVLHGERGTRVQTSEPVSPTGEVVAPEWLDETALAVWNRLAPSLRSRGVLTAWDVDTFAVLCDAIARHRQAAALVAKAGVLVRGKDNRTVKNPAAQLVRDYAGIVTSYGGRFGLTPADRAQLAIEPDGERGAERLLT